MPNVPPPPAPPKSKDEIFDICKKMEHAAVLADLERRGKIFRDEIEKGHAWEWTYQQRLESEFGQALALKKTAKFTFWVAIATFLTAFVALVALLSHIF